jgi:hypothetical protein
MLGGTHPLIAEFRVERAGPDLPGSPKILEGVLQALLHIKKRVIRLAALVAEPAKPRLLEFPQEPHRRVLLLDGRRWIAGTVRDERRRDTRPDLLVRAAQHFLERRARHPPQLVVRQLHRRAHPRRRRFAPTAAAAAKFTRRVSRRVQGAVARGGRIRLAGGAVGLGRPAEILAASHAAPPGPSFAT